MRRRSRLCVLAGLMGGMSLLVLAAAPANADKAVGGDSIAVASANGGSGGSVAIHVDPLTVSGNSGPAVAQSSATNTGNTGPASSTSVSNPVSISGDSGSTGRTGDVHTSVARSSTQMYRIGLPPVVVTGADRGGVIKSRAGGHQGEGDGRRQRQVGRQRQLGTHGQRQRRWRGRVQRQLRCNLGRQRPVGQYGRRRERRQGERGRR